MVLNRKPGPSVDRAEISKKARTAVEADALTPLDPQLRFVAAFAKLELMMEQAQQTIDRAKRLIEEMERWDWE